MQISYKMASNIYDNVKNSCTGERNFPRSLTASHKLYYPSSIITTIGDSSGNCFGDYISSDKGRELMKNLMKEVLLDVVSRQEIEAKDV